MHVFNNNLRLATLGLALLHSHLCAQPIPAPVLLEQALYAQHIILDDRRALELHLAVISNESATGTKAWAESSKHAIPLLIQDGQRQRAIKLAEDLLRSSNPELKPWAVWAGNFLKNLRRLPLNPQPWPEDEYLYFVLRSKNDAVIGFAHYWIGATEHNGISAVDLRSASLITLNHMSNTTRIIAKPVDQQWLPMVVHNWPEIQMLPQSETIFDWENFTATIRSENGRSNVLSLVPDQATLDLEQFTLLPRLLNPEQATEVSLPIAMHGTSILTGMWQFRGTTEITLVAETYQVEHWHATISQPGVFNQRMDLYVDTGPQRLPLRFEADLYHMELVSATVRSGLESYSVSVPGTEYVFAVPTGWVSHTESDPTSTTLAYIMSFDAEGFGFFSRRSLASEPSIEEGQYDFTAILERNIRRLTQILPNYEISDQREDGWTASYMLGSTLVREQRTYWISGDSLFWTVIQSSAARWDPLLPAFQFWLDSFSRIAGLEEASIP